MTDRDRVAGGHYGSTQQGGEREQDRELEFSLPPSPTSHRRLPHSSSMTHAEGDAEADERSPLLLTSSTNRRRARIEDGHETPQQQQQQQQQQQAGHLARNQSYQSYQSHQSHQGYPSSLPGSVRALHHNRANSWGQRLVHALSERQEYGGGGGGGGGVGGGVGGGAVAESKGSVFPDDRVWYDQFTSTDWVHDSIADAHRVKALRARRGFWGRAHRLFDSAQGWILSALVGFVVAVVAYLVDVAEAATFDYKDGYCARGWYISERKCCPHGPCTDWREWGELLQGWPFGERWTEFVVYVGIVVLLASLSCLLTLTTKTVVPSAYRLSTLDENLAADAFDPHPEPLGGDAVAGAAAAAASAAASAASSPRQVASPTLNTNMNGSDNNSPIRRAHDENAAVNNNKNDNHHHHHKNNKNGNGIGKKKNATVSSSADNNSTPPMVYYSAAGSGVAEVRVILSGFVLHGFLGLQTLVVKSVGLVLSVASGLSLGKEGPYVHIATCIGNIACRLFAKYDRNDAKRREVLSAAAAAGVAVAFGAPLGGVLFGLEEVAYFFPAKTLFRTFFCCITAALTLKFLNPYGTHKIVMFQVRYLVDWEYFELASFVVVGVLGGAAGALFIKASHRWAHTFRRVPLIKAYPLLEVVLVAFVTGVVGYWNELVRLPVAKLLYNLAAPCDDRDTNLDDLGLCPSSMEEIPPILGTLLLAFLIKGVLTTITFGIKVPAGIYVPSMVVGGLMGRLIGHVVQYAVMAFPDWEIWADCARMPNATCIQPGVYGLIAAGATMCGVTRLSVTLAVILFELTGSLDYVLPFSLAVLVAKWTADAIEPLSIYDLLTEMNSYPYLNNKHKPIFTADLADIVPRVRPERLIDITRSPYVRAASLRTKLEVLHKAGELDGGLPIIRDGGVLVGLIPAPDLEYALDNLDDEPTAHCLMMADAAGSVPGVRRRAPFYRDGVETGSDGNSDDDEDDDDDEEDDEEAGRRLVADPHDFTPYIDPAPVALDIHSPMDLVYECFVKLGLRYVCVLRDGRYAGMTHKKMFVKYMRELEKKEGHH